MAKSKVESKADDSIEQRMSRYDRYQLASHKDRPRSMDYIDQLISEFSELSGDRNFRDDPAAICGLGRFREMPVGVIAQEMGKEAKELLENKYIR